MNASLTKQGTLVAWNLPDWRNPTEYIAHTSHAQWRWEFMRRLPEYRQDWLERDNSSQVAQGEYSDRMLEQLGTQHPSVPEGFSSFREALAEIGFSKNNNHIDKWGLRALFPPYRRVLTPDSWNNLGTTYYSHEGFKSFGSIEFDEKRVPENTLMVQFDLTGNLTEQLSSVKALLKEEQRARAIVIGNRKLTSVEMIRYLRVLDAKEAGEKNRSIGEQLRPPLKGEQAADEAKRLFRKAKQVQLKMACK